MWLSITSTLTSLTRKNSIPCNQRIQTTNSRLDQGTILRECFQHVLSPKTSGDERRPSPDIFCRRSHTLRRPQTDTGTSSLKGRCETQTGCRRCIGNHRASAPGNTNEMVCSYGCRTEKGWKSPPNRRSAEPQRSHSPRDAPHTFTI